MPRHGFTEENLVDIISGDDLVLNDVFQFHEPPIRRLPNLLMKRLLTEISEYVCKPAVNGQIVLRYFHRQFYKFFKQYRQKELYQLALAFLDGTLHDKYPARQISVEKEENSAIVSSELPWVLFRLSQIDLTYLEHFSSEILNVEHILRRVFFGQVLEFISDCENFKSLLKKAYENPETRQMAKLQSLQMRNSRINAICRILSKKSFFIEGFK